MQKLFAVALFSLALLLSFSLDKNSRGNIALTHTSPCTNYYAPGIAIPSGYGAAYDLTGGGQLEVQADAPKPPPPWTWDATSPPTTSTSSPTSTGTTPGSP